MKGVLGLLPALLSPAGRSRVLWLAGQLRITIREERDDGQHIGRRSDGRLGCACGRQEERQRSTRLGEGSTRLEKSYGESASSALQKAPVSEVRRIVIRLKLTTASFVDPPLP